MLNIEPGPVGVQRTPDNWVEKPYELFEVVPLTTTIGAEIIGIDLSERLPSDLFTELHRAFLEWKVLFFRNQTISREDQRQFASLWGELEINPLLAQDDDPEIVRLEKNAQVGGRENMWHADMTWQPAPPIGAVLRAIDVPPFGGDTLWADMAVAYDILPSEIKTQIDGLNAIHDVRSSFGRFMDAESCEALGKQYPPVEHPIVIHHPETGRKTLYVNEIVTSKICGLDEQEGDALLSYLVGRSRTPEVQCRFRWQPGSVAFWDNRATQHYACSDYFPQRRVMERISILPPT